jgi:hypothetical protein
MSIFWFSVLLVVSIIDSKETVINYYYMASITSSEMADFNWPRSTFRGPLFSCNITVHYVKTNACILKQNSKLN